MNTHFKTGTILEPVTFELKGLPDGKTFEDLNINHQRLIRASVLQQQVNQILNGRVGLLCMGRVSTYATYKEARNVQKELIYLDSQIYLPPGVKGPQSDDENVVYEIGTSTSSENLS